jgi:hypothetical protein
MYFSGLHRGIKDLEEKKFYDIALLFLSSKGYQELAIIDGTGDGGRDVTCSWENLRIQLSVQKNWEAKINKEAAATKLADRKHFIYVTNRRIRDNEREEFFQSRYKLHGDVDVTVFDLDSIATTLSLPGRIEAAYEKLGFVINSKLSATPKEVALSNTLLFSKEAKDLRDNVLESNLKSHLFASTSASEVELLDAVTKSYGTRNVAGPANRALQRLRASREVEAREGLLYLNDRAAAEIKAAKQDFLQAKSLDLKGICEKYNLAEPDADSLISTALEILARRGDFHGDKVHEVGLAQIIAENGIGHRKFALYQDLSRLACARVALYGEAVDHVFSTDTFDIFRVLGQSTEVAVLLDSSVAMPLLFGLSFANANSRYGIGASALHELCKSHNISIKVPQPYLNEMANHGKKALEYLAIYDLIGEEPKNVLRSSGNAYISHYSHIRDIPEFSNKLSLKQFLQYFGVTQEAGSWSIENRIQSLLESFSIEVVSTPVSAEDIREKIGLVKKNEHPIIIEHDAAVCTYLKQNTDAGFIFATWDYALTAVVENMSRIYADTPSRVVDFLSMSGGAEYESETSFSLLDTLIHCDERKTEALARRIEEIRNSELAFELQQFSDEARRSRGHSIDANDLLLPFFSDRPTSALTSPE